MGRRSRSWLIVGAVVALLVIADAALSGSYFAGLSSGWRVGSLHSPPLSAPVAVGRSSAGSGSGAVMSPREPVAVSDCLFMPGGRVSTRSDTVRVMRGCVRARARTNDADRILYLVQFTASPRPEWLAQLKRTGVRVICYVPANAYLVEGTPEQVARCRTWAQGAHIVQWDGEFLPEWKLHSVLKREAGMLPGQLAGTVRRSVVIQAVSGMRYERELVARLKRDLKGDIKQKFSLLGFRYIVCDVPVSVVEALADIPGVVSVTPFSIPRKFDERQAVIVAGCVSGDLLAGPGYLSWLESLGFTQAQFDESGFVVDVSDSGIDNGTTEPNHFALYRMGRPDQGSRVAYSRLVGVPNSGVLAGCDGHGTLDAHILAGYVDGPTGFPHEDAQGYKYGLGICPFVRVGASVIFDPEEWTHPDPVELVSSAYHLGARISNNSWGDPWVPGEYTLFCQIYDALVRDAVPASASAPLPGNQEMVIVFAAGNSGPDPGTVCPPGLAKNVICVGASENVRSLGVGSGGVNPSGCDGCGERICDSAADNLNDIAWFSSRGPCGDGRMKPDLVAPGTHITGGVPQEFPVPDPYTSLGCADACYLATGVCALPGSGWESGNPNNYFPTNQMFYTVSSGTSHSAPAVAGACALLRQFFINHGLPPPSPALTKAWLMNSARYLTGADAGDSLWSSNQGMGLLDLGRAFDGTPRLIRDQVPVDMFTGTGQRRVYWGTIGATNKPFRVTLAWTDAPGKVLAGAAYNNDLDLTVYVNGVEYKGNVFDGEYSVPGGEHDRVNNVESVFLPPGTCGEFVVVVSAANICDDGVPQVGGPLDQDFALVVYNVGAALGIDGVRLVEEESESTNGVIDSGEVVTLELGLKNHGVEPVPNLALDVYPADGMLTLGVLSNCVSLGPGETCGVSARLLVVGQCGDVLRGCLAVFADGRELVLMEFPVSVGGVTTNVVIAWNTNQILWSGTNSGGALEPYPSAIEVDAATGTVSRVRVWLCGVTHETPESLMAMLVAPDGRGVLLMGGVGAGFAVSNVDLCFDADARQLPLVDQISSGTYAPTVNLDIPEWPLPEPSVTNLVGLEDLPGCAPTGVWCLYVVDTMGLSGGQLTGGWGLELELTNGVCAVRQRELVDLRVLMRVATQQVNVGEELQYEIVLTNAGTCRATSVVVTNVLPPELELVGCEPCVGEATTNGHVLVWGVGELESGAAACCVVTAMTRGSGIFELAAGCGCTEPDPFPGNNQVIVQVSVNQPPLVLGLPAELFCEIPTNIGPIRIQVVDPDSALSNVVVFPLTGDPAVIPPRNVVFWRAAEDMAELYLWAEVTGKCDVVVVASDGLGATTNRMRLVLYPVNFEPWFWPVSETPLHVYQGQAVTITHNVTDQNILFGDEPRQQLEFWLGAGSPPGAVIDPRSGVINWSTDARDIGTNELVVFVTDGGWDGWNAKTNSVTHTVVVHRLPELKLTMNAPENGLVLSWPTVPGYSYRLLRKFDLSEPWHCVTNAWGETLEWFAWEWELSTWLPACTNPACYFRLQVIPP